jgi:hypothetical protein
LYCQESLLVVLVVVVVVLVVVVLMLVVANRQRGSIALLITQCKGEILMFALTFVQMLFCTMYY